MANLYTVTLAWGGDDEGTYTTNVWANDEQHAVRLTAEEMADSGDVEFDTPEEREEWIADTITGFRDVCMTAKQVKYDLALLYAKELYPEDAPATDINMAELGKVLAENRERLLAAA